MTDVLPKDTDVLEAASSILVVVDVQQKLTPRIDVIDSVIANIVKLVKLSHILDVPVLLTEQQNLGGTVPEILSACNGLPPISKLVFSCFGSESFQTQLKRHQRSTIVLTGIEAHICVAQTAIAASASYRVQVVSDAVASRNPWDHQIALDRLRHSGVTITSTEMAMYEWLKQAGTDVFRHALPLLKSE